MTSKHKNIITLFLILLFVSSFYTKSMTADEWVEDIDFLANKLPELHKNLFFNINEVNFNKEIEELKADLENLEDIDIALRITEIFSDIGDSHTGINIHGYISKYYPVFFQKFGSDYFVVAAHSEYSGLIGTRLKLINGQDIETVRDKMKSIIVAENNAAVGYRIQDYLNLPELLEYTQLIDDKVTYTFDTTVGLIEFSPDEYSINELSERMIQNFDYQPGIAYRNASQLFWHQFLEDEKILYFQYNQCWSRELEERKTGKDADYLPSFINIVTEMLQTLENRDVEKLVIDMRHNSGGSSVQGTAFAQILEQLEKKPEVYVVIGNRTFSSAIINAIQFRKYNDAILIGEATRGKPNHFGEVKTFDLPNSNLSVQYSTNYFRFMEDDPDSLYPDITVETNYYDFVNGIDTVLEKIKEL
ncbi:MAG: hypothetical protein ACLFPF_03680 [Halanaerobiales bacterium]